MDILASFNPFEGSMEKPILDVSEIRRKFLEIPYANASPSQRLDIYLPPEGDGPFPAIIFVHGGAFILGDKRDDQFLQAIGGIGRGYAVVSVEYRLAFEAKYPAAIFDVKAAIRFLRANAQAYKLDAGRFGLCGDSAGGHYAVMTAATQGNSVFEDFSLGNGTYSSAVQAIASRFGPYDFILESRMAREEPPKADPYFPDIEMHLLGAHSEDIGGLAHFTNPLNFITSDLPPIFLEHGTDDVIVPVIHSRQMEERVRAVCGAGHAELVIREGYNHGGIDQRWNAPEINEEMFAFFDKHLK
ncbi:Acetyl esterase/lipase [Sporobacter termitidis DSM 10068]|uniref:Acetyl esterase/lipase n=1 Tax=Sporobacter termitidis DSM 10068 TaxID=1123282 RepID=A0A1M5Y3P4_9FIRM|nr:alpha/beta hydrolase [Sporobacter termitidis]SHI06434.1 Acetyl esterase/lipase [Sporobacter termitidis DSM 10068]